MHQLAVPFLLMSAIYVDISAVPLTQKSVDLTHAFDENTISFPITRNPDNFTLTSAFYYPYGVRVVSENYASSTHAGTHIDAPSHFYPGATTVDKLPLDQLTGPAAVVDITHRASLDPDTEMTVEDLLQWESATGHTLNGTIVLMNSGYGQKYTNRTKFLGTSENDLYKVRFPGVSPETALFMVTNRTVKGAGVDTVSFDRGLTREYMSHKTFLGHGRFILEMVANLDKVPAYGATLDVQPMKMANSGGAPVRIVATYYK